MNRPAIIGIAITFGIHASLAGGVAAFSTWSGEEDEAPR